MIIQFKPKKTWYTVYLKYTHNTGVNGILPFNIKAINAKEAGYKAFKSYLVSYGTNAMIKIDKINRGRNDNI